MNNVLLTGVAALLLGGVGGYLVGSLGSDPAPGPGSSTPPSKAERAIATGSRSDEARGGSKRDLREIMQEPGKTRRLQSLMDFYADLDPAEFAAEADKLDELPFTDRILAAALLFSRWAELAPEEAMAYAKDMGRGGFMVRPTIVSSWAASDPIGAAQYYSENKDEFGGFRGFGGRGGANGMNTAGQIAGEWAKQDPVAALEWAQGLEERDSSAAVASVFRELTRTDPAKAAEMASTLDGEQQSDAYASIARQWASTDWDSAEQWISSLPADQQDRAMSQAIRSLADNDPLLASRQVSGIGDPEDRNDAVNAVARNWAQQDPAAAAEWLAGQDVEDYDRPMRDIMQNWVSSDPGAALEFLDAQPAGELRDEAAQSYVMANREGDARESLQIAETIENEGMRSRTIMMSTMRWMQEDKDAAAAYLRESPDVSEEQAQRLIERAESGRGFDFGRGGRGGRGR